MVRRDLALLAALFAGCSSGALEHVGAPSSAVAVSRRFVTSNILRTDYAGSAACADCHPDIYERWARSPMHRMTRDASLADVRVPFPSAFAFKTDRAELEERGGERFMRIVSPSAGTHLYRMTRVIGGRYREDFAGVEVGATGDDELILPLTYVYSTQSFRLKGYSVMVGERPGLKAGGVWNRTCILCHNTAPQLTQLLGAVAGPSDRVVYQGAIVDDLLPEERRAHLRITDRAQAERAMAEEIAFLGGTPPGDSGGRASVTEAIRATREHFAAKHLVELGIGCEACHGGAREHAADPRKLPSFAPIGPFLEVLPHRGGPSSRAELVNRACARCHQILFSRYPYTWEGGERKHEPGGSTISSGEARDFLLGGCQGALACTMCHDPHAEDDPARLAEIETPAGNRICTGCHSGLADASRLKEHAHHDPKGSGGACVACHMPKKNMGLGYALTRYHRVGIPTDPARVENDRPLECALCHADRSALELLGSIERLWGRKYDTAKLRALYRDLSRPILLTTIENGKPHEQAAAIGVLQSHRVEGATPLLLEALAHRIPLVRYYAKSALEKMLGRPIPIDVGIDAAEIRRRAAELEWTR